MPINGLCPACEEQIEWRKKYRKYKPLTVPKKWYRHTHDVSLLNDVLVFSATRRLSRMLIM